MANFILVSGAWHGNWCWEYLGPLLRRSGHYVLTPNLAGMGSDERELPKDDALRVWADDIADLVREQEEPVILVGHSRGGIVISEVAERVCDRIGLLVYLAGYLVPSGRTLAEMRNTIPSAVTAKRDQVVRLSGDGLYTTVAPGASREFFYNRTSDDRLLHVEQNLSREPVSPSTCPLVLSDERYGTVPRAYIETLHDRAISIDLQRWMHTLQSCEHVITLDSDHSPFYSAPAELAGALNSLAHAV
ncbi:alpha/beta fold hydrolase [Caballeronia sp. dw_19]|uniref:alpha/beta fold hydrolase n=1 Tax=Caballeronia sp. dw_19 TaxID=2719791 RepID=UPI001BD20F92|nr:alpha/beta fold hydrolase [Caballeronia sp. dw_19]